MIIKVLKTLVGTVIAVLAVVGVFFGVSGILYAIGWAAIWVFPHFCYGKCEFIDYFTLGYFVIMGGGLLVLLVGFGAQITGVKDWSA